MGYKYSVGSLTQKLAKLVIPEIPAVAHTRMRNSSTFGPTSIFAAGQRARTGPDCVGRLKAELRAAVSKSPFAILQEQMPDSEKKHLKAQAEKTGAAEWREPDGKQEDTATKFLQLAGFTERGTEWIAYM